MHRFLIPLICCFVLVGCRQNAATVKQDSPELNPTFKFHYEVRLPKIQSTNPPLLLLLHGLGSNEKDLFSFAEYLDPSLIIVAARAPIHLRENSYSWFNLQREGDGWTYGFEQVEHSSNELIDYIDQLVKHYSADRQKIFLGGFSQGAIMSLATGLTNPDKIKGIICLSGRLYPELKQKIPNSKKLQDLEIFISHGKQDKVLPYADIVSDVEYLNSVGLQPTVKYYEAAHTISQDNFRDMISWITSQLK